MARRDREINIFNIAFLDVITGAMGAFVLLVVLLSANLKKADVKPDQQPEQTQQRQQEQAQATNNNTNNNEDLRERLRQALNEIENLKGRLQRALEAAQRAKEKAAELETALNQAGPTPDYWALIDVIPQPACGKIEFSPEIHSIADKLPGGFTDAKNAQEFVNRSTAAFLVSRSGGKFHDLNQTFFVSFQSSFVGRFLFGIRTQPFLPEGCEFQTEIMLSSDHLPGPLRGVIAPSFKATPNGNHILLAAFPDKGLSVTPLPDDVAAWQKESTASDSGAKK